jgi:hypothetical protein
VQLLLALMGAGFVVYRLISAFTGHPGPLR